jgi:DNA polymerase I
VWLRSLIKPGPGMAIAYIDYSSMEFLIAAALSGDPLMLELYASDPYLGFAKRAGMVASTANKTTHGEVRDRYKTGLLSIQYGVGPETLALRLGVSAFEAAEMLAQHHELFAVYWRWSADWLAHVLDTGEMRTVLAGSARPASRSGTRARWRTGRCNRMERKFCALPAYWRTDTGSGFARRFMTPC